MVRARPRSNPRDGHRAGNTVALVAHRNKPGETPATIAQLLTRPEDPLWILREENYEPALEHEVESRFAVSNGFLGARASLERPTRASRPRSYVAGFFGTPPDGTPGRALIPGPDWSHVELALDGEPLTLESGEILAHSRTLNLRRGLLITDWRQRQPSGRAVQLRTLRLASLADRSLGLQLAQIRVEQPAAMTIEAGVALPAEVAVRVADDAEVGILRTEDAQHSLAVAIDCQLHVGQRALPGSDAASLSCRWHWDAKPREPATLAKIVAVARNGSKTRGPERKAVASLRRARRAGLQQLIAEHADAWNERWSDSDVVVQGDPSAQGALRFALYHLTGAANPEDEHTSIAARALTGDSYRGHTFWDTDIFVLPFYTLTWPAAARALLMYRYHTLPAARAKAAGLGYRGALYAWESADTGDETTPSSALGPGGQVIPIRSGTEEQHISADVAYAVWQYWNATRDNEFLHEAGAEILLDTARFWASRAQLEPDGCYHIRGVVGPDEYHEEIDDNAYTNVMAQWNLERAQDVVQLLKRRWPRRWTALRRKLRLRADEPDRWADVAGRLVVLQDPSTGLIEQFAGFFQLEPIDLGGYEPRGAPMDVLLGPERVQRSQVIKQADVIMLLALRWDRFSGQAREANFHYYEPRCGHGSSLSPPVHAFVAAKLGKTALASRYFRETAAIDLDDTTGNAAGGVHIGALGGLWQAAIFGFAGLALEQDGIAFDPHLPDDWDELSFPLQWRGRSLRVTIRREPLTVEVILEAGKALAVRIGNQQHRLVHGDAWTCRSAPGRSGWKDVP